ncbi:DUF952 domain-containing protein [Micrococcus terreus]|uniref:DUF952 domain-containing protein n=1 Tax=Micrococcus terreus TaxID=574650 RepID=UPI0023F69F84|nr:DUF952 domain-containing protein [Micrococcus terreus]
MAVLHIAEQSDWETAQQAGVYDRSTRGASITQVGYLHGSATMDQVRTVLGFVYADVTEPLVLLTLDEGELAAHGLRVLLEPGDPQDPDSELFPHVYGGAVPVSAVRAVEPLSRD